MTRVGLSSPRRTVSAAIVVVALALIPAAIAWACNPQAHISLDQSSYAPGSTMTVYGSYFPAATTISIAGPAGSTSAQTNGGGAFTATLTAPAAPGTYTVTASRPTGGFAPASFTVAAPEPAPAAPAPAEAAPPPAASEEQVETPAIARSERQRAQSQQGERSREPSTTRQPAPAAQPVFSGSTSSTTAATSTFAAATTPATTEAPSRARREGNRGRATTRANASQPSQQTAFTDVWSAYEPGRTPSLVAGSSGAPAGGTGSQLAWGIGLLAVAMLGLVGGLAYTEARRRRAV